MQENIFLVKTATPTDSLSIHLNRFIIIPYFLSSIGVVKILELLLLLVHFFNDQTIDLSLLLKFWDF